MESVECKEASQEHITEVGLVGERNGCRRVRCRNTEAA